MDIGKEIPPQRSYDEILHEVSEKFRELIDTARKNSAPLDLTRSGTLLPDFEQFRTYLEAVRAEVITGALSQRDKDQLESFIDGRLSTVQEYIKILQGEEKRKKEIN